MERIEFARESGQENLYCETCTQYLYLDDRAYFEKGNGEGVKYLCAPPLRSELDVEILWQGVANGVVDVIATDHCPFTIAEKNKGLDDFTKAPGGIPGVEERVRVIFSEGVMKGRITLNRFVEIMSTNPAKIFGMYPKKGSLVVGTDADIIVIDPSSKSKISAADIRGSSEYTAYQGLEVQGGIHLVFSRGKLIAKDNEFLGNKGDGEFIFRNPTDI
ncbi:amidohydrolase family protein [Microaceticoccus formicicus]|uniref:amidohydrolase family protein n=1 Tax=Microaceticoccus formicicus TaxID=3118105 RepID=UPI003CD00285|nr:amidohydrolase family protein [Peptoniphilaceae bacterium AMB_02]